MVRIAVLDDYAENALDLADWDSVPDSKVVFFKEHVTDPDALVAMLDGFDVRGLDQTGLSQKAGPVVSDLRLSRSGPRASNLVSEGGADVIIDWMPSALASREKGVPLVNIAQPFKRSGMMLTCRKDTGIAGPDGGTEEKPVGLVHIAVARDGRKTLLDRHVFDGGRDSVRMQSVDATLALVKGVAG